MDGNNENESNVNAEKQTTVQADSTPNKSNKKTGIIIGVVAAVIIICLILAILVIGGIFLVYRRYVTNNNNNIKLPNTASNTSITSQEENKQEEGNPQVSNNAHPIVEMTLEEGKVVKMELYPEYAPNTVANFLDLVSNGFYDGLTFHRLVEDFVLQGGDPNGTGASSSDYSIKGEFSNNGYSQNTLKHTTGVLSMARSDYSTIGTGLGLSSDLSEDLAEEGYNSAYSQFFIMLAPNTYLDGNYAAFGKVVEGMNYIEDLSNPDDYSIEDENGTIKAEEQPKIVKMTIDNAGRNYLQQYGKVKRQSAFDYSGFMTKIYSSSNIVEEELDKFFEHTEQD